MNELADKSAIITAAVRIGKQIALSNGAAGSEDRVAASFRSSR